MKAERTVTVKLDLSIPSVNTSTSWEFLNADGHWVRCIGGESHAKEAASNDGPGRYRKATVLTVHEERAV